MTNFPELPLGLLQEEDSSFLVENAQRIRSDWQKRQIFRTDSEARASVLNDLHHPTPDAKYWQAVREHALMAEQLIHMGFDWRRNELALARAEQRMQLAVDPLVASEAEIDRDEALFKRLALRQIAADRVREIRMWQTLQDELLPHVIDPVHIDTQQAIGLARRWLLAARHLAPGANPAETENTLGQAISFARLAASRGQLPAVLDGLPEDTRQIVAQFLPEAIPA